MQYISHQDVHTGVCVCVCESEDARQRRRWAIPKVVSSVSPALPARAPASLQ